jgi:hypothetical protein
MSTPSAADGRTGAGAPEFKPANVLLRSPVHPSVSICGP